MISSLQKIATKYLEINLFRCENSLLFVGSRKWLFSFVFVESPCPSPVCRICLVGGRRSCVVGGRETEVWERKRERWRRRNLKEIEMRDVYFDCFREMEKRDWERGERDIRVHERD